VALAMEAVVFCVLCWSIMTDPLFHFGLLVPLASAAETGAGRNILLRYLGIEL
jgi:hypothetical protein